MKLLLHLVIPVLVVLSLCSCETGKKTLAPTYNFSNPNKFTVLNGTVISVDGNKKMLAGDTSVVTEAFMQERIALLITNP